MWLLKSPFLLQRLMLPAPRQTLLDDHVIVFNAIGLQRLMHLYRNYDERSRTHLSLDNDPPMPRPIARPSEGRIVTISQVGGLHHRDERHAA